MSGLIIRYRKAIVGIILGLTLFFLYHARNFRIYHDLAEMSPANHPYTKLEEKLEYAFGGTNLITIGLIVDRGDIFDKRILAKIYRITQALKELRGVVPYRILSIASRKFKYAYLTVDPDGIEVFHAIPFETLVEKVLEGGTRELEQLKKAILRNDLIYGPIVSFDLKGTIIQADFQWERDYQYIFENIQKIIQQEEDSSTHFYLGGHPIELGYLHLQLKQVYYAFGLALMVIFIMLYLSFQSKRGMLLPLLSAMVTIIWGMGIMGLKKIPLDIMSITVPFLILAIGVSHSLQIIKRYYEQYHIWQDNIRASQETIKGLWKPALAATLTDSAGFAALMIFPFKMLQSMTLVATICILSLIITSFLLIPVLLSLLPPPKDRKREIEGQKGVLDRIMEREAQFCIGRGKWGIILIALIITGLAYLEGRGLKIGDLQEGSPNLWPGSQYNRDLRILNSKFPGTEDYYLLVETEKEDSICQPGLIKEIALLQDFLRSRPEVGYTLSYVDILKKINQAWNSSNIAPDGLPTSKAMAWQYLEMFVSSGGDPEDTRSFFTMDYSLANIQILLKSHQSQVVQRIIQETNNFLNQHQDYQFKGQIKLAGGNIGIYAAIMEEIERKHPWSILFIGLFIYFTCLILFRSFIGVLVIFIPSLVGLIWTSGLMSWAEIGLFLPTVPVASIGVGIGVDFAIYLLSRLKEELAKNESTLRAYQNALTSSGKAIFFTAMVMSGGVLMLVVSGLRFQAIFAAMVVFIMVSHMIAALVILPAVVALVKPRFLYRQR
jgi:hypothetical protein